MIKYVKFIDILSKHENTDDLVGTDQSIIV